VTGNSRDAEATDRQSSSRSRSRTDLVYESLRSSLLKGVLEPGSRLVEANVARDLGVSRTPIREALRRLESEGLVKSVPNSGFRVADFLEDLGDIFLIRGRVEGLAGFLAAGKITLEELETLEDLQQKMEHQLTSADPNVQKTDLLERRVPPDCIAGIQIKTTGAHG
jgi:DNA-binding GntR family transcriptional regulator